ncbi:MAG: hypothetical protein JSW55_07185 [Chloroflexota bacterium]|nr:MAG: hypothetical protein JSW55_07185 [Chloroflexota bacterium]
MKRVLALSGLLLVAATIAAGAIFGVSRLSTSTAAAQEPAAQEPKPERVMVIAVEEVKNGERFGGEVRITFADPPELPERAEDAAGLFLGQAGDELSLGTGSIEVDVSVEAINDQEPVTTVNASHDGDEVQVAVDENTVYYKDVTERPEITQEIVEAGQLRLTRALEPGSPDEIGQNMMIRAWGQVEDGRLVADLIVYDPIR